MPRPLYIIVQTIFVRSWQNLHEFGPHKVLFQTIFTWQYLYVFVQTIFVCLVQTIFEGFVPDNICMFWSWQYLFRPDKICMFHTRFCSQQYSHDIICMFWSRQYLFGPDKICMVHTRFCYRQYLHDNICMFLSRQYLFSIQTKFACFGPHNVCMF